MADIPLGRLPLGAACRTCPNVMTILNAAIHTAEADIDNADKLPAFHPIVNASPEMVCEDGGSAAFVKVPCPVLMGETNGGRVAHASDCVLGNPCCAEASAPSLNGPDVVAAGDGSCEGDEAAILATTS